MTKPIQVTFTFDVDDYVTDDQIDLIVSHACVQLEEPTDEEGESADFVTSHIDTDWFHIR